MKNKITIELDAHQADILLSILSKEIDAGGWVKTAEWLYEEVNAQLMETINNEPDQFRTDAEADADALASAGFGTDEDYGYFGSEE